MKTLIMYRTLPSRWREYLAILLSLVILALLPGWLRRYDHTAATLDPGIVSAVVLAIGTAITFVVLAWWLIRNLWPVLSTCIGSDLIIHFKQLNSCQQIIISLSTFWLLLFACVATLAALL